MATRLDLPPNAVQNAVLVIKLYPSNHDTSPFNSVIEAVTAHTQDRLLVVLHNVLHPDAIVPVDEWVNITRLLTRVYVRATGVAQKMNKILMRIDVQLRDLLTSDGAEWKGVEWTVPWDVVFTIGEDNPPLPSHVSPTKLPPITSSRADFEAQKLSSGASSEKDQLPVVALGGTFDHLHAGHKILISIGAFLATEKLIVGVTSDALLVKKTNKEVLEPIGLRMDNVHDLLSIFKPTIKPDIVPIEDVYGPTGWDPNVQGLVVSKETLEGAASIAKHRKEKGFPELRTFVIDVISATAESIDDSDMTALRSAKMSSTFIREWIVEQRKESSS